MFLNKKSNKIENLSFLDYRHKLLISRILQAIEKFRLPETIILYGSFSKGEGTWDLDGQTPYNDIDLIFIDKKLNNEDLDKYKDLLFKELNTKFIDISLYKKKKSLNLKSSIFSFDLFENGLVLHGEINLNKYRFDKARITTKDIDILFRTRIWTFIGSYPKNGYTNLTLHEQNFFNYQMSKAIFSIIDCLSILKKEYVSKYEDKIIWAKKQKEFDDFNDFIVFAEQVKVNGIISFNFTQNNTLILAVGIMFHRIFQEGLQNHYNSKLKLPELVNSVFMYSFRARLMKLLYFLKGVNGFELYNLIIAQYYLFEKIIKFEWNEKEFKKIVKKLNLKGNCIDEFRIEIANKRL